LARGGSGIDPVIATLGVGNSDAVRRT